MVLLVWYKSCNWSWVSRARKEIQYYQNKKVCVDICSWWLKIVCQHSVTYQIVTGHLHTSMVIFNVGNPRVIHFDSLYHDLRKLIVCYNRPSLSSSWSKSYSLFFFLFYLMKILKTLVHMYVFSFFKVITMQYMATGKEFVDFLEGPHDICTS